MWSSPALNQLFPSGKITAMYTDIITTVLELLRVLRMQNCILSCTCAPLRVDRVRDKQYKGVKSRAQNPPLPFPTLLKKQHRAPVSFLLQS